MGNNRKLPHITDEKLGTKSDLLGESLTTQTEEADDISRIFVMISQSFTPAIKDNICGGNIKSNYCVIRTYDQ